MASMMFTNIFTQGHDSDKNYRGWACIETSVELTRPFADRGGIVATDIKEVDD